MIARELAGAAAAFAFLVFVPRKKIWPGFFLFAATVLLAVTAGQSPLTIAGNMKNVVTSARTLGTTGVVLQIGILSALMKHYGFLDRLLAAFNELFPSSKAVITTLPAAFGLLTVPGGAQLSAPFVDSLGEKMGMSPVNRAVVNLTYRHMAYFILPTSSSMMLLAGMMPELNLYHLISLNFAFIFIMEFSSYLLYLGSARNIRSQTGDRIRAAGDIALYLSPIYLILIFNGIFGVPMFFSVLIPVLLIFAVTGRRDVGEFAAVCRDGFSTRMLVMMLAVYFMQHTVYGLHGIMELFRTSFTTMSGWKVLVLIATAATASGASTGLSFVPLGVLIPMLCDLHFSAPRELVYVFFIYAWSFTGYYFSPLHLCQLLTLEEMHITSGELFRAYAPLMAIMAASTFVLFGIYSAVLL